jgi:hypothetical protein
MATITVPRGATEDWLKIDTTGEKLEVIEGPNLQAGPDNLTQINRADGTFLQEDVSRRKVSGTQKLYVLDDALVLPVAGQVWTRTGATAAPYKVRIDEVNVEGQAEEAYQAVSIAFHYFETIADGNLTDTDISAAS